MAVVKVKSVKTGLDKTAKSIINPDKTEGGRLVSVIGSAATAPEGIARAMADDLKATRFGIRSGTVLGRHVIQSFDPEDDLTPEEAHLLGKAFATEITGGNHKYVIATHTDRNHIHHRVPLAGRAVPQHPRLVRVGLPRRELPGRVCWSISTDEPFQYAEPVSRTRPVSGPCTTTSSSYTSS